MLYLDERQDDWGCRRRGWRGTGLSLLSPELRRAGESCEEDWHFIASSSCSVGRVKRHSPSAAHQEKGQEEQGERAQKQWTPQHLEKVDEIMAEEKKKTLNNLHSCKPTCMQAMTDSPASYS